jgi:rfaE bifunctional protein nucleotidyltransferase chain/domain
VVKEDKIRQIEDLAVLLEELRGRNRRIIQCHGVFDLLHVGHVRHFERAKRLGDVLVVSITPDRFVNKGVNRPAFAEDLRAEVVSSLDCVDYVVVNRWPTAVEAIKALRPHVFAKGSEFRDGNDTTGHISLEEEAVRSVGGELAFTEDITFSSSALINQYLGNFGEEVREYLTNFAREFSAADVLRFLKAAASTKVLLIGETIIDDYQYCEALGKAGKEPVLVTRHLSTDQFAGGVLACANHVASFCDSVDVLTFLGDSDDQRPFLLSKLKPNVHPMFLHKGASPTIRKKRFVEKYLSQKLFEVYYINDDPLSSKEDAEFCASLQTMLPHYDLVIIADYGHGMLSPRAVDLLCKQANFLAVNTQSNAGNNGLNTISKYPRADYICLAHREFALETRNSRLAPEEMILQVAEKLRCPNVMLTRGKYGSLYYSAPDGFLRAPAFATTVIDRVGAGDAVLCVTALSVAAGAPPAVVVFLGNVVGAEAVKILGNERSIERIPLFRQVECLLKVHKVDGEVQGADVKARRAA